MFDITVLDSKENNQAVAESLTKKLNDSAAILTTSSTAQNQPISYIQEEDTSSKTATNSPPQTEHKFPFHLHGISYFSNLFVELHL